MLMQGELKKSIRDMFGGFVNKWKHASFPIPIASFLDVLSLIRCLNIASQQEEHDPVKAVRQIQEFIWTTA